MAKLHYRYSAMNSGKTTTLIQEAHNYESRGMNVLVTKPANDTKGEATVVSRLDISRPVDFLITPEASVVQLIGPTILEKHISCVFIDEAQFLQPSQAEEFYWGISEDLDTAVIAYGLRADFRAEGFPGSRVIMDLGDELEERATICRCGKKARFNTRMVNGVYVFEGDQVAIDGENDVSYDSLCKSCYRHEYLASTGIKSALDLLMPNIAKVAHEPSAVS